MTYVIVLWLELSPAFLEKLQSKAADAVARFLDRIMVFIIALGLLLPTMHQSSLGAVIMLAGPRLHPLWQTAWLPALFLISCIAMGYAVVVMESVLSSRAFGRRREDRMLASLSRAMIPVLLAYVVLRLAAIVAAGKTALLFSSGLMSVLFWLEMAAFLVPAVVFMVRGRDIPVGCMYRQALTVLVGGALYRFDSYLVAFSPVPRLELLPERARAGDDRRAGLARGVPVHRHREEVPDPERHRPRRQPPGRPGGSPMSKRIVVDPVTRIEGHLRIDVEVDGGKVTKAWSSGQMWRGIENILKGRDPREAWLFTQRFCGVCTTVHAIASVRAVENAVGLEIPLNAQYIRNLIVAAHAHARPHRALLPPVGPGLGGRGVGPEGRPGGDGQAGPVAVAAGPATASRSSRP